jgi:hypothetical protein
MEKKPKSNDYKPFWSEYDVPENEPLKITIGPLAIWCIKVDRELRLAWKRHDQNRDTDDSNLPEELEWQRWAFSQKKPRIEIKPVFPDRPVLVKPENPFTVAEDAQVRIFVRVPIWIRINLMGKQKTQLVEIPVVTLSNTWFGTFQEGDLCYWISSGARLTIEPDSKRSYLAICPIQLIDRSPVNLNVEKICLRVEHLSLFYYHGQLWAGETQVTYKGNTEISEIKYSQKAPKESRNAKLLVEPRIRIDKSITARTFSTIKELPGFGLLLKE